MANRILARLACAAGFLACSQFAAVAAAATPEFPSNPASWINSPPMTLAAVQGKAVFVYYYDLDCPRCRARWPEIMAAAKKFEGQPIAFVAVNSGNPRAAVEKYVHEVGLTWPVIVDTSREYEKQSHVGTISLQNIYQACIITPDGKMSLGRPEISEASLAGALKGAHWRVAPSDVPPSLKVAWQAVECSNFPAGAASIKKSLSSGKADVKECAEKLDAAVRAEMDKQLTAAKEAQIKSDAWAAYKAYARLSEHFQGYDLPPEVAQAKTDLAANDEVKTQLAAQKSLDAAKKLAATDRSPTHARAVAALKRVAHDVPNTEAGKEAATMLENVGK